MKIGVIGTGYVGLVQGIILSDFGLDVTCVDVDITKIENLQKGILPIYEPSLKELLDKNYQAGRLKFTTDIKSTVESSLVLFIAVGTPPKDDGSADLQYVLQVARDIAINLNDYKVIVNKSTVPVGTGRLVENEISSILKDRKVSFDFDVVSNPEFLREGKAVVDCLNPDRVVIGSDSPKAIDIMKKVYDVLYINQTPFVFTNRETSELIKYASNAFLAVKISFINEIALLAEKVGANTQEIARAMGMDGRISPKFLHCGPGFGGSCFPKDTKAIIDIAKQYDEQMFVIQAAIEANEKQKKKMVDKIHSKIGSIKGKEIAVLGLSFKPETDDMRDAPSIDIIRGLVAKGAKIRAYCPQGMHEASWRLADLELNITYCKSEYDAVVGVDALVLVTEWHQFRGMDLVHISQVMKDKYFFDLRNVFAKHNEVRQLFDYYPIGQS